MYLEEQQYIQETKLGNDIRRLMGTINWRVRAIA
jgi:hypothetical protein